jgi:D-beta-D-heptose 7-phosphate kinase/D-beta-D-heptose 1-phosphate adenosyltransferase
LSLQPEQITRLHTVIDHLTKARVLVIGDLILDHYLWGKVSRISPEAPVPVVHVDSESFLLGGAANVYHNAVALGVKAELCGIVGTDESGRHLIKALKLPPLARGGILLDKERPTTKKTRVLAHHQQVVRVDVESRAPIPISLEKKLLRHVASRLPHIDCIVISDYAKGVVTASLVAGLVRLAGDRKVPVIVDPKVEHFSYYKGVTLVTPNHFEALQAAGVHADDDRGVCQAGESLRQRLGCRAVLVTRGEKGMSLFETHGKAWHVPTVAKQVFDVTGAGDTVIGTFAAAIAVGASFRDAATIANHAAGIVVGMVGTATVTPQQLREALGAA